MQHRIKIITILLLAVPACCVLWFGSISCKQKKDTGTSALFQQLDALQTNIHFSNDLSYDAKFNVYTYRNFYNGGGVAIGDINNDGLPDIFFTANMMPNKLYLNKGNFQFEDITEKAGIVKKGKWSTGVSMADVNGDGLLDIYVCNSGDIKGDNRQNELYINNGFNHGHLRERAARNMVWMTKACPPMLLFLIMIMMAILICSY